MESGFRAEADDGLKLGKRWEWVLIQTAAAGRHGPASTGSHKVSPNLNQRLARIGQQRHAEAALGRLRPLKAAFWDFIFLATEGQMGHSWSAGAQKLWRFILQEAFREICKVGAYCFGLDFREGFGAARGIEGEFHYWQGGRSVEY
jgi:hypothetical protein